MKKKLGFALGAGGSRGIAHIGFLKAMEEGGIKPDFIAGSSMGSVVGACYASGMSPDRMKEEIDKLKIMKLVDISPNPLKDGAFLRSKKMRAVIRYYLGHKKVGDLDIPFSCVAVDLLSGNLKVFCKDDRVADAVAASSSLPSVFRPIEKDGMLLVDGGVRCRVPIQEVRDMGAKIIVAIDVLGGIRSVDKKMNMVKILSRSFDIIDCAHTDLCVETLKPDLFIRPDMGDMSQYSLKEKQLAFDAGYKAGVDNLQAIKALIKQKKEN